MNLANHPESLKALAKAEDAVKAAEYDLTSRFTLAAINRTYYACYYCMAALLITKDVYAKTHQGTRAKFSELLECLGVFSKLSSPFILSNIYNHYSPTNLT